MKNISSLSLILFTSALSAAFSTYAYEPPQTGAPSGRVGAGTRFSDEEKMAPAAAPVPAPAPEFRMESAEPMYQLKSPVAAQAIPSPEKVQLLTPNKTAFTASATPVLYWYVSNVPSYPVEITVQSKGKALLKKNIGIIATSGMQRIRLADYGIKLKAGKDYTWSVALIVDPKQRHKDVLSSATIRYQKPAKPLIDVTQMQQAGYWYDAVMQLIDSNSPQLPDFLLKEGIQLK